MGLLSAIIWIVIGVIYVIYKAFKEEREETLGYIKWLAIILLPLLFSILVFQSGREVTLSNTLLAYGFAGVIYVIEFIFWKYVIKGEKYASKSKQEMINEMCEKRLDIIAQELEDAGYKVSYKVWKCRFNRESQKSTYEQMLLAEFIKSEPFLMPLYLRQQERPATAAEVYEMVSKSETRELCSFPSQKLCDILGIPLSTVPCNSKVTKQDVIDKRIREAEEDAKNKNTSTSKLQSKISYLKKGEFIFTEDINKEKMRQQRVALTLIILEKMGLKFVATWQSLHYLPQREYIEQVRAVVYREAKNLDTIFVDHEVECAKRENELNAMDEETFETLLGLKLDAIPINEKLNEGLSVKQRKALAVQYILRQEGLDLYKAGENYAWLRKAAQEIKSFNKSYESVTERFVDDVFSDCYEEFKRYVDKHSIEILSQKREKYLNGCTFDVLSEITGVTLEEVMYRTAVNDEFDGKPDTEKVRPYVIKYILKIENLRFPARSTNTSKVDDSKYNIFESCVGSYKRERELSKMDEAELSELLGVYLKDFLSDSVDDGSQLTEAQRKALAIKYILEQEGAELAIYGDNAKSIEKNVDRLYPRFKQSVGAVLINKNQP